jgi:hypothetical protein
MAMTPAESSRGAIESLLKIRAGISLRIWEKVWAYPGVETPVTLDGPDVPDGDDVVEAAGVDGWRRVRRVCRVVWLFYLTRNI